MKRCKQTRCYKNHSCLFRLLQVILGRSYKTGRSCFCSVDGGNFHLLMNRHKIGVWNSSPYILILAQGCPKGHLPSLITGKFFLTLHLLISSTGCSPHPVGHYVKPQNSLGNIIAKVMFNMNNAWSKRFEEPTAYPLHNYEISFVSINIYVHNCVILLNLFFFFFSNQSYFLGRMHSLLNALELESWSSKDDLTLILCPWLQNNYLSHLLTSPL